MFLAVVLAEEILGEQPEPNVVRAFASLHSSVPARELAKMIATAHIAQRLYWRRAMEQRPRGDQALLHS